MLSTLIPRITHSMRDVVWPDLQRNDLVSNINAKRTILMSTERMSTSHLHQPEKTHRSSDSVFQTNVVDVAPPHAVHRTNFVVVAPPLLKETEFCFSSKQMQSNRWRLHEFAVEHMSNSPIHFNFSLHMNTRIHNVNTGCAAKRTHTNHS